ncbi:protein phosphatase [Sorangium cellulosum]|uniref:Protein phosphatase n=1 Tax=Sorangium cellulosum TaxID=56 RepID=A0A2L0EVS1_SORCE|nr:PEGA domain-containing protein [Sorangium cellulosum]AUX43372.1 protein phosphatase [Sorangium cellulosum]
MSRLTALFLVIALPGCGGAAREPEPVDPKPAPVATQPEPEPEPPLDDAPMLDVTSAQPTEVLLDGKPIGTTPITGRKVAPGSHEVTFVDPERGNRTMMVTLEPGDAKTVQSDPPPSIVEMGGGDKDKDKDKDKEGDKKK